MLKEELNKLKESNETSCLNIEKDEINLKTSEKQNDQQLKVIENLKEINKQLKEDYETLQSKTLYIIFYFFKFKSAKNNVRY